MYKLYTVNNKTKSYIKGFWQDNNKKIYIDNIYLNYCYTKYKLLILIKKAFLSGEKACFFTFNNKAYIMNNDKSIITLKNKKTIIKDKLSINEIKRLLKEYNGLTIFKNEYFIDNKKLCDYTIEIFF